MIVRGVSARAVAAEAGGEEVVARGVVRALGIGGLDQGRGRSLVGGAYTTALLCVRVVRVLGLI